MLATFPYKRIQHADLGGAFDYVVPDGLEDHARVYAFLTTVPLNYWRSKESSLINVYASVVQAQENPNVWFWDHLGVDGYDVPILSDCSLPPIPWPFFEAYMDEVEARRA